MEKNLEKIIELLKEFTYGDGITYTQIKDVISEFENNKELQELLNNTLDELFFCGFDEFEKKLKGFEKTIKKVIEGKYNFKKAVQKARKKIEDTELVNDFIIESKEGLSEFEMKLLEYENTKDKNLINDIFRTVHTIKGSSGFLELDVLNTFSHMVENLLDDLRNEKLPVTESVTDFLFEVLDILKKNFDLLSKNLKKGYFPEFDINIDFTKEKIEKIVSGEKQEETTVEELPEDDSESEENKEYAKQPDKKIIKSIKVDIDKVDTLLDDVGELIVANNMLFQDERILKINSKKTQNILNQVKRISSRLQNSSMTLRMVPIGNTFQKMMRIVRDNSKRLKKLIKLEISGEYTEIDRNMVDKLYDPLMHMIRNSCDHGIESPEAREKKGKKPTGTIWLSAYNKGGNIIIEIKDNGQGLSKEKILKKALENGVISEDESLSDNEIYNLIFAPGFSTAEKVSEISGRGVGMDVVKNTINELGGKVDIESKPGEGSTFFIKLPLTLAILDGVVIRIGSERYILPAQVVQEAIQPEKKDCFNMANKGEVVKVRGEIFRMVRMYDYLELTPDNTEPSEGIVILIETDKNDIAIFADEILGKQEVVIKNLSNFFQEYDFISGSAIMGDGTISLIIDVNKI
ncbi:MAG: chemotaxis protein CheA [Candidatus Muiribacteriota bacterium]